MPWKEEEQVCGHNLLYDLKSLKYAMESKCKPFFLATDGDGFVREKCFQRTRQKFASFQK